MGIEKLYLVLAKSSYREFYQTFNNKWLIEILVYPNGLCKAFPGEK